MKRLLYRLIRMVIVVTWVWGGLALCIFASGEENWSVLLMVCEEGRWIAFWVGMAMFWAGILFLFSGVRTRNKARFLSFDGENGTVSVSTAAISDYILKLKPEFPSIIRMRTVVVPRRHAIDIVLELRVKAGPGIHEVCQLLQQRVRETMANGLGISQVRKIEVSVGEIVSEHRPT